MYLFHLFRSFLPLHNPIGFGVSDFLELGFALLLILLLVGRASLEAAAQKLARKPALAMAFLFALVIVLRLALLPLHPVPTPAGADDFSYLLLGDTLAHFRLANPAHAMHQFFETNFVLQQPSYSSIYPLGPAFALALGQLVFGVPWAGVLLSVAAFCAGCYWMLRGWTTPGWALAGGLLAVCQFGPLNSWMNTYWGGAVSAIAGCLVFGALPRIVGHRSVEDTQGLKPGSAGDATARLKPCPDTRPSSSLSVARGAMHRSLTVAARGRNSILLGLGIGLQMLSRPYESVLLGLSVVLFFAPELRWRKGLVQAALPAFLAVLPAAGLLLLHNHAVTGSWTTLPYQLSRYQYGVPTTFTYQPNPVPHAQLTQAQQLYYEGQAAVHGETDSPALYLARLASRVPFARFFFLAPLLLALPFFVPLLRQFRYAWIVLTLAIFILGDGFYPYFFPHYIAAAACLFLLMAILGLERLSAVKIDCWPSGRQAARWIAILCGAHFLFWYGVHAFGNEQTLRAMTPFESAPGINFGDPDSRIAINRQLAEASGRQLVFVRYFSTHEYHEWIHNAADIDGARIVWALDLSPDENAKLRQYYPDRKVWLLEPDALPPKLIRYPSTSGPFETVE